MKRIFRYSFLLLSVTLACRTGYSPSRTAGASNQLFPGYESLPPDEQRLADTLLAYALDHEALYSLADTLKPISTVRQMTFAVEDSTLRDGTAEVALNRAALDSVRRVQRVLTALSCGRLEFVLMPFQHLYEQKKRHFEVVVCRKDLIDRKLRQYAPFFGQWGITEGASPGILLILTEYEARNDRYRAYGYLFGYPKHAVDFFVQASQEEKKTGQFVKRDFFHNPTYASTKGYFTYAIPKGYQATEIDSAIYRRASVTLSNYRQRRSRYKTSTGLQAVWLLREWEAAGSSTEKK